MKYLKSWSGFYDHIVMNCKDIFIDNSVDDIHFFISYIEYSSELVLLIESDVSYLDTGGDFIDNIFRVISMIEGAGFTYSHGDVLFSAYVDTGERTKIELDFSSDIINFKFKDGDTISMEPGKLAIKEIKLFFNS
jgi:hypothetical protein